VNRCSEKYQGNFQAGVPPRLISGRVATEIMAEPTSEEFVEGKGEDERPKLIA